MNSLTLEMVRDGNIEQCRDLCNELMAFQKSRAKIMPHVFDSMDFETRMKVSYEQAAHSHLVVLKDHETPVGYVFSTIMPMVPPEQEIVPPWAPVQHLETYQGMFPAWNPMPEECGCLNNLYLRKPYQGMGFGSAMCDMALAWMAGFSKVTAAFVYVSNGNDAALRFYLERGFLFSHDVFGGFIKAAYYPFRRLAAPA